MALDTNDLLELMGLPNGPVGFDWKYGRWRDAPLNLPAAERTLDRLIGHDLAAQHMLIAVARHLPFHPRSLALASLSGCAMSLAVAAIREDVAFEACEAHGLESARGEAAGQLLIELARDGAAGPLLRLMVAGAPLDLLAKEPTESFLRHRGATRHTALIEAAACGRAEITKALIEAGAMLDVRSEGMGGSCTALMNAAHEGRAETVAALIQAGAGLDLQEQYYGEDHGTALMLAAGNGHAETVALLIEAGAGLD